MNFKIMVGKGLAILADILESCNPEPAPEVPSEPLDFTKDRRGWGHNYNILEVIDSGKVLRLAMWSSPRPVVGQMLLLDNNGRSTCYQAVEVSKGQNVDDMSFVTAKFAPRMVAA